MLALSRILRFYALKTNPKFNAGGEVEAKPGTIYEREPLAPNRSPTYHPSGVKTISLLSNARGFYPLKAAPPINTDRTLGAQAMYFPPPPPIRDSLLLLGTSESCLVFNKSKAHSLGFLPLISLLHFVESSGFLVSSKSGILATAKRGSAY